MAEAPVEMDKLTDEVKEKLREFDEEEAFLLLCQIFSYAQATKDYTKFQTDLYEWKKRYPVDLFSEQYRYKIKYMLSKEFLETVLKDFIIFDELSKKDPSVGLEKLRKILSSAEKHKDEKKLDKDLDNLYKEYPLSYLKEKYPHLINQLVGKANREKILQKFDSSLAFNEYKQITEHPDQFKNTDEFKASLEELQKLFPTQDFNEKYKSQVEKLIAEFTDERKLQEIFPTVNELDLTQGEVIPLELHEDIKNIAKVNKDALYDFSKIMGKDSSDINGLFTWLYTYRKYINSLDTDTKNVIVTNLMSKYEKDMPPVGTHYMIPQMDSKPNELLSLKEYSSIDDFKKNAVLQMLGMLATGQELTHEDIYRLGIINSNVEKVKTIEDAKIEEKLDLFIKDFPEDKLTPYDELYVAVPEQEFSKKTPEQPKNSSFEEAVLVTEPEEVIESKEGTTIIIHEDDNINSQKENFKTVETADKVEENSESIETFKEDFEVIVKDFEDNKNEVASENVIDEEVDSLDEESEPIKEVKEPSKRESFFAKLRAIVKKDEEEPQEDLQVKKKNTSSTDAGGGAVGIARPGEEGPVEGLNLLNDEDFERDDH